jgi:hypothetical protein
MNYVRSAKRIIDPDSEINIPYIKKIGGLQSQGIMGDIRLWRNHTGSEVLLIPALF